MQTLIKKFPPLLLLTLLILPSFILLYFNYQSLWSTPKYHVTIAVSQTPLSTPFYVAQAIDAFNDTCVNVELSDVIGGQSAFAKVMREEVDFGTSSDSVIAFQSLAKKPFVTHAMFVQSDNDVKLITRPLDHINSVKDLKGKRIGVTKGTASEYFLSILLALEGLSVEDITLLDIKPEELVDSFAANKVDAIVPWEPFAFQGKQLLNDQIKVHETKNLNSLSFNLISQTADNLLVKKATCVLQGLALAIDYIASHPDEAQKIVINKLNLSPAFIEWIWPDYVFKLALNQSLILSIESQAKWAFATQTIDFYELPEITKHIDSRAMLKVEPAAVSVPL